MNDTQEDDNAQQVKREAMIFLKFRYRMMPKNNGQTLRLIIIRNNAFTTKDGKKNQETRRANNNK